MLQDPNVERYVQDALKPLLKRIKILENSVEVLGNTTTKRISCSHPETFVTTTKDGDLKCFGCGQILKFAEDQN